MKNEQGFTLIELIIVVAILLIIGTLAVSALKHTGVVSGGSVGDGQGHYTRSDR